MKHIECPFCRHRDERNGFGTRPLPQMERGRHVQIYICPRCNRAFAPMPVEMSR